MEIPQHVIFTCLWVFMLKLLVSSFCSQNYSFHPFSSCCKLCPYIPGCCVPCIAIYISEHSPMCHMPPWPLFSRQSLSQNPSSQMVQVGFCRREALNKESQRDTKTPWGRVLGLANNEEADFPHAKTKVPSP